MRKLKQLESVDDNLTISTKSSTPSSIPIDLLIDIFSRVPSKSIARFRCLSKSWASILGLPYFTDLFLAKSSNHPRLLFTVKVDNELVFFSAPQTQNKYAKNSSLVVVATRYQTHSSNLDIKSSLHGLVCCQDWCGNYTTPVICNPATGEFLTLPEVKTNFHRSGIYCGYDPTDKNFKVLCRISATRPSLVLTLKTGKLLWRMIECKPHHVMFSRGHMICIDGVLYYLARFVQSTECVIVCFDVRSEKFSYINDDDNESMARGSTLINYKGRLGAVRFTDSTQRTLCLWLLDDAAGINKWSENIYQLPLSWKRKHNPCTNGFQIVGMTRTCDIVLSPYKFSYPFYVFYYNVERKALARIEIQGLQELKRCGVTLHTFQDYVEDLTLAKSLY